MIVSGIGLASFAIERPIATTQPYFWRSLNGTILAYYLLSEFPESLCAVLRCWMLKLKKSHFPRAISRKYYEEDPDAVALETGVESEVISGMQQALTQADDDDPFGDCVLCRQPIAEGRLKHLPWAAYCSTCDPEGGKPGAGFELSKAA